MPSVLKYTCLDEKDSRHLSKAFYRDMIKRFSNENNTILENFTANNNVSYNDINLTRRYVSIKGGVIETLETN